MIQMGNKAKCIVTGFEGIATGRSEYLNGCVQWCLTPKAKKDGSVPEARWIDEGQIEVITGGVKVRPKNTGGPQPSPPRTSYRG